MRFHWQNLNEGGWPHEGRAWLRMLGLHFQFSWALWSHFCGLSVGTDEEDGAKVHVAFPPVSFWFFVSREGWRQRRSREVKLSIHDWAIWWTLWRDPDGGWDSRVPRWREGCWHVLDTLLGRTKYSRVDLGQHAILIPLPEGQYEATATYERCTWKRPRWFARVRDYTKVDVTTKGGLPHQGKGENSWDCGIDGLCGYAVDGHNLPAAIAKGVESTLRSRGRYDGSIAAQYPAPGAGVRP